MKERVKELKNHILPLLFSISLTYWAMSSFFGVPVLGTLAVIVVLHSLLFIGFINYRKRIVLGFILFFFGSILYFLLAWAFLAIPSSFYGKQLYFIWAIVTRPDNVNFIPEYWFGTILFAAYGFSYTVFYFTVVRFRVAILFMIGIIAFMLQSAKTDKGISIPFIIFIVLFFSLYVERVRRKDGGGYNSRFVNHRWYLAAMAVFILFILALSFIAPKPNSIPKLASIDAVINQTIQPLIAAATTQGYDSEQKTFNPSYFKNESYIDSITAPLSSRVLFEVKAEEPLYFRTQGWDRYEKNRWMIGNSAMSKGYPVDSFSERQMKLGVITSLINRAEKNSLMESAFPQMTDVLKYRSIPQKSKNASILTNHYSIRYFLNPPGMTSLERVQGDQTVFINEYGRCIGNNPPEIDERYSVEYISQQIGMSTREFQIVRRLDKDLASSILDIDRYTVVNDPDHEMNQAKDTRIMMSPREKSILLTAQSEMETAYKYYTNLPDDLPGRIYNLANSLVADKKSDYDKASAIENFFHLSGFTYDLKPPSAPYGRDYTDFFIFESKKGVCIHFASAMVILARACGLPARYVEGFVANEKDPETGNYLIREKDAHAFPEIYIAGYGWMVFEPTVSANETESGISQVFRNVVKTVTYLISSVANIFQMAPLWVKIAFVPFIAVVLLFLVSVYIRLMRDIWVRRVLKTGKREALGEVFAKIAILLKKIQLDKKKYETPSGYALRVFNESGIELLGLADAFNRSKYGDTEPSGKDIESALGTYRQAMVFVKKRVGKLKAWMI